MTAPDDRPRFNIPIPDPSELTEKRFHEVERRQQDIIEQARRELDSSMALRDVKHKRLRADLDKLEKDLADSLLRIEHFHDDSVKHTVDLLNEKIRGVCTTIAALETRFTDADAAHDARSKLIQETGKEALKLSFESNEKLGAVVTEQFKSEIARTASTSEEQIKALRSEVNGLKERVDKNEGNMAAEAAAQITARANLQAQFGQTTTQQGARTLSLGEIGKWIAIAAVIVSVAAVIVSIVSKVQ